MRSVRHSRRVSRSYEGAPFRWLRRNTPSTMSADSVLAHSGSARRHCLVSSRTEYIISQLLGPVVKQSAIVAVQNTAEVNVYCASPTVCIIPHRRHPRRRISSWSTPIVPFISILAHEKRALMSFIRRGVISILFPSPTMICHGYNHHARLLGDSPFQGSRDTNL